MLKGSFAKKLTASYLFVVAATLLVTAAFLAPRLQRIFLKQLQQSLQAQALLIAQQLVPVFAVHTTPSAALQERVYGLEKNLGLRVSMIGRDGVVLADSERTLAEVPRMDNHLSRPEVRAALSTGAGEAMRMSDTLHETMLYVAVPVHDSASGASPIGLLRVALPVTQVDQRIAELRHNLLAAGAAAMIVALVVALFAVRRVHRPLQELIDHAESIGEGRFTGPPASTRPRDEFGRLSHAFAQMAQRVETTVADLKQERSQLSATLSSLVEGVVALDHEGRILFLNPAAERIFGAPSDSIKGRPFLEGLRQSPLNEVLSETLARRKPLAREITVHSPAERVLNVQAIPVDYGNGQIGVVAALHDVTELRKLENLRRDFIANASHELKTPLTSIKGFVETLLDGALNDPKNNRQFLETIDEQTNRLMRLVEDLLDLSAIEARRVEYSFEPLALAEIVERLEKALAPMAKAKDVKLKLTIKATLPRVRADRGKLTQILMNLLDNAIKFNRAGGHVRLSAVPAGSHLHISVEDTGIGLAPDDIPRVFERFFRADKAHSHDITGTGLGLAIVKHLVEAHQGKVHVTSTLGQGSIFTFTLPLA